MNICKNCNTENKNDSKFCVNCGGKIDIITTPQQPQQPSNIASQATPMPQQFEQNMQTPPPISGDRVQTNHSFQEQQPMTGSTVPSFQNQPIAGVPTPPPNVNIAQNPMQQPQTGAYVPPAVQQPSGTNPMQNQPQVNTYNPPSIQNQSPAVGQPNFVGYNPPNAVPGYGNMQVGQQKKSKAPLIIVFVIIGVLILSAIIGVIIFVTSNVLGGGSLAVDTEWEGTITISDYRGVYEDISGEYAVMGHILEDDYGNVFFEVYDYESVEAFYLLSLYVEIDEKKLIPIIGYEDAWFYDEYLTEESGEKLDMYLSGNELIVEYEYDYLGDIFDAKIVLEQID